METRLNNKYETFSEKYKQVTASKEILAAFVYGKTVYDIAQELDVSRDHAYYLLNKYNLFDKCKSQFTGKSHFEDDIVSYIGADICQSGNRSILNGKEIDIFIPSLNIGIEFNGTH